MDEQNYNATSYAQIVETNLDMVYRIALHHTSNISDADDITQEVFVKYISSPKIFESDEYLKAWLIRVTINLCKNHYRLLRKTVVGLQDDFPAPTPINQYILDEVRKLKPNFRNVIYLHYYEGYTAKEIGKILGVSQNTVLSWLKRGREALRSKLDGGDFDE